MDICKCGKEHRSNTRHTVVGKDALQSLPGIVAEAGSQNILLVADINTYRLAGQKTAILLKQFTLRELVYDDICLTPDEKAVGQLLVATWPEDAAAPVDMIIALGAGTINDLCRYVSYRLKIPYIIVATAPSMDGYASNVSPLIVNGLKTTYEAAVAYAIIGDTDLLCIAPVDMIGAGFGDILGKYNCINDWELGRIVNNEYYCEDIAELTRSSIATCVAHVDGLRSKSETSIAALMEGLTLSGVAMSYVGNSRPASGSEHHLSHFWEMMFLFEGRAPVLHGAKVGVATLVMIRLLELLSNESIDWEAVYDKAKYPPDTDFSTVMERIYRQAAPGIIIAAAKSRRNSVESTLERLRTYQRNWPLILDTIRRNIPDYDTVKGLLEKAGSPISPAAIGIQRDSFINGICYAKEIRQRYTILQMTSDLGLLPAYADILAGFFYDI